MSSAASNIKKLSVAIENQNGASFASSKISGSMGDSSCSTQGGGGVPCSGDSDGVGTFARYNTISGVALQVTADASGSDVALFVLDQGNNKIRRLELTSGLYVMTTFDAGPVDLVGGFLAGIALNSATGMMYVGAISAIYSYRLSAGASSKALLAGKQNAADPFASKCPVAECRSC